MLPTWTGYSFMGCRLSDRIRLHQATLCRASPSLPHRGGAAYVGRMTLQEIADRIEIDDLLTRYATGVDRRDWDLWETCFTPDAHIDYTAFGGIKGDVREVRRWLAETMVRF